MVSTRKPTSKNCPICGQFMELLWVDRDNPVIVHIKPLVCEDRVVVFRCNSCCEFDSEDYTAYYQWEIYKDTIDFSELSDDECAIIKNELTEMKQAFLNRPYLAVPNIY